MEKGIKKEFSSATEKAKGKRVSKTWLAALKSQGSGWCTYPKFVKLTQECKGE